jgi:CheY-like chemotaxis protein
MGYILLIEDNPLNAEIVTILLSTLKLEVRHAMKGLEGAKMARQDRPTLILMDFDLPDIDGRTLALQLKKQLGDKNAPPIVAVTAHVGKSEERLAKHFGCTAFVGKPIVDDEFLTLIQRLLPSEIA